MTYYNWSVDPKRLKKDKDAWQKWRLEQMINFGLRGGRLSKRLLIKYWPQLNLDPAKKRYLEFLLWEKNQSK